VPVDLDQVPPDLECMPTDNTVLDDGFALDVVTRNYQTYYELKHNYLTLLKIAKGETVVITPKVTK
jgi:hypothetical protein